MAEFGCSGIVPRDAFMKRQRRWTEQETRLLHSLGKQHYPAEAISYRLKRPLTAVRRKAQRERVNLNLATPLPELDTDGTLLRLGGLDIPGRPKWINRSDEQ
jgi:hypothetical protein